MFAHSQPGLVSSDFQLYFQIEGGFSPDFIWHSGTIAQCWFHANASTVRPQSSYWNRLAEDGALSGSDCLAFYTPFIAYCSVETPLGVASW